MARRRESGADMPPEGMVDVGADELPDAVPAVSPAETQVSAAPLAPGCGQRRCAVCGEPGMVADQVSDNYTRYVCKNRGLGCPGTLREERGALMTVAKRENLRRQSATTPCEKCGASMRAGKTEGRVTYYYCTAGCPGGRKVIRQVMS